VTWPALVLADPDVHAAFADFYADTYGVRSRYLGLMSVLAAHFAEHPAVIGYDMFNEPWGWEDTEIGPLYEDTAAVIRAQHPEAILWVEGHASTNNGISQTNLSRPTFDNYAYAPHFYEASVLATHLWTGIPTGVEYGFGTMASKAQEWNVPLFLGEFGTHGGTVNAEAYMELHYDQLDQLLASSVQWNYTPRWTEEDKDGWNREDLSIVDESGKLRGNFTVRPQPQRIGGLPTAFRADEQEVELRWENDPSAGTTHFFLPAQHLWGTDTPEVIPDGFGLACSYNSTHSRVSCESTQGGKMTVTVRP
jgi:endoglycosylceramidase